MGPPPSRQQVGLSKGTMPSLLRKLSIAFDRLNGNGPKAEHTRLHPGDFAGMLQPVSQ